MNTKSRIALISLMALGLAVFALGQQPGGKPQGNSAPRPTPVLTENAVHEWVKTHVMTIDEAVSIAMTMNRSLATAVANLDAAKGDTALTRTQLNPQADANANITQYNKEVSASFGGQSLLLTNQYNPIYSASITLPVDLTGAIHASVSQAQFREVAARIDFNRVRNETIFAVRNAFYGALRAQGQLVVSQDNLASSEARLRDAKATLRVGVGTEFDVLTAQRDVADAQQGVLQARGGVTLALGQLKSVIGIDVSEPLKIVDTDAVEDPLGQAREKVEVTAPENGSDERFHSAQNEVALGPEYAAAVREALNARPEVLESDAAVSAAQQGIYYAKRSGLPSLSLSANYVVQPNNAGFTPERQASLGLGLTIPLYDGGIASASVKEAKAAKENAEVQRRNAIDYVTLDVQQAYVNLVQARDRVQVANVGLIQAKEAFRMARLRASEGVTATPQASPELELSNAQTTLTQAESNRVTALYDYNVARSQLQRAMGRYSYGVGPGFAKVPTKRDVGAK